MRYINLRFTFTYLLSNILTTLCFIQDNLLLLVIKCMVLVHVFIIRKADLKPRCKPYNCLPFYSCENEYNTNRPSASISGHITVDFDRTLRISDVDSVDAVRVFAGFVDVVTVTWFV